MFYRVFLQPTIGSLKHGRDGHKIKHTLTEAVVPCRNKIILKNFSVLF